MASPLEFVKVVRTCIACPSQWDAWNAEGDYYYLRYRSGRGTIEETPGPDPATWTPSNVTLLDHFREGDGLSGSMDLDEFLNHTAYSLAPGAEVIGEDDAYWYEDER